jgi:FtsX-like permease family
MALTAGVVSISINHSMNHVLAHPDLSGDPWDVAFSPQTTTDRAQLERHLDTLPSVASWFSIIDTRANVEGERVHVRLLGGDPAAAAYAIGAGRSPLAENEAIVGYGLFDEFGWSIGQTIDMTFDGSHEQFAVVGWYRETEDGGHIIQIREPATTSSDEARTYALTAADGTTKFPLAEDVRTLGTHVAINEPDGTNLQPFKLAMTIMALLVTAVALAHMFATSLATARSRSRDEAALRAVGVTRWTLSLATATGTLLTTALAFAVGVPAALTLQRIIGDAITAAVGAGPGITPSPPALAVTTFAIALIALAVLVEIVASRRTGAHQSRAARVD